ncbi:MAG: DUF3990 domain-containing protein [Prevotella sp.]|jgi:hypothetical protein|nr:DUF3990 domain-containing protein [Prevotella sp.]MBQ6422203.1 DUF3990 domain-containing protein [Prevotella sp.]MBR2250599.1 DUF3990 domain-containing protein [Prevotella sp.]
MTLYHGSNQDIVSIDLEKGLMYKDFGKGFYLTPDKATAIRMAQKKARIFGGEPTLITYELDEKGLNSEIKVKRFPAKANVDWFLFIDANRDRKQKQPVHNYDIVIGPIADDGVVLQLANFHQGIYSAQDAARYLQDRYLDQQYFFGTEKALSIIKKIRTELV